MTVLEAKSQIGGRVCDDDSLGVCVPKGAQILNGALNNPIAIICEQVCVSNVQPNYHRLEESISVKSTTK